MFLDPIQRRFEIDARCQFYSVAVPNTKRGLRWHLSQAINKDPIYQAAIPHIPIGNFIRPIGELMATIISQVIIDQHRYATK